MFTCTQKEFWQWDADVFLSVDAADGAFIHFCRMGSTDVYSLEVEDGKVAVPNILLQAAGTISVYTYVIGDDGKRTVQHTAIKVKSRPQPPEYIYTPTPVIMFPIPEGGTDGQYLVKDGQDPYKTKWVDGGGGGGSADHRDLEHRDAADQHPIGAITGLQSAIDGKSALGHTHDDRYYTEAEVNDLLADKADADDIPTRTSDLTNDSGFLTAHRVQYITCTEDGGVKSFDKTFLQIQAMLTINILPIVLYDGRYYTYGCYKIGRYWFYSIETNQSKIYNLNIDSDDAVASGTMEIASQTSLSAHTGNNAIHVTASDKSSWNAKADTIYVDTAISSAIAVIDSLVGSGEV